MDQKEMLSKLLKAFRKQMDGDREVAAFYAKCRDGTASYADVYSLAERAGIKMTTSIRNMIIDAFPSGVPPEVIDQVIPEALREQCDVVIAGADRVQRITNTRAGVQLAPVEMDPNEDRIRGLAEHFKDSGFSDETVELITNLAKSTVDDAIKCNAEFQSDSGMKVTVTRIYDDVGLNHGKEQCQWCIDRCGENVEYAEAIARGMFERHPGCGCTIEYHTAKGTRRQAEWTRNSWEDSEDVINRRKTIGL